MSKKEGAIILVDANSDILIQKVSKCVRAALRPPDANPWASTMALMLPAPVAVIPSKVRRSSSSKRSSNPGEGAVTSPALQRQVDRFAL